MTRAIVFFAGILVSLAGCEAPQSDYGARPSEAPPAGASSSPSAPAAVRGLGKDVVDLLREAEPGSECVVELDAEGNLVAAKAGVLVAAVPESCRTAADSHVPGGRIVGAAKAWAQGKVYWQVDKEVEGVRYEVYMAPDGTLAGLEAALRPSDVPAAVMEAAKKVGAGGDLVVVERVSGPEAAYGEDFHAKVRVLGEVLRISVKGDGTVVRVMRKMKAEVRAPR
jgi:hypothetical protein